MDGEKPRVKINPAFLNYLNKKQNPGAATDPSELYESKNLSQKLGNNALNNMENKDALLSRFMLNKNDYYLLKEQAGNKKNKITGKMELMTLNLEESASLMVSSTAETISFLTGEKKAPAADEVIYLDKSARPVSWFVDEFWDDFTDSKKPSTSYLAIDRRPWFKQVGIELTENEEITEPDGSKRVATGDDFWKHFNALPEEKQTEYLARIRCLYIEGGIEEENPDKIMATPSRLDGKNITIIDEVARSGSTMEIAKGLIKRAFPEANSVNGHVFWYDQSLITENGVQMGSAPFWYPHDSSIWYGRAVKDINPTIYQKKYMDEPTPENRAKAYGAIVLGIPFTQEDFEKEPGRLSAKLREDVKQLHKDYVDGHVLPRVVNLEEDGKVYQNITKKMTALGVEYASMEEAKNKYNTNAYLTERLSTS